MQEKLQLLKELQFLDSERQTLSQQCRTFEKEQDLLQADLDKVQIMVDSLASSIEECETQRREFCKALALEEGNIARAEGRLTQIKTQKEYVAVLKEVDTAKKIAKEVSGQIAVKDSELAALGEEKAEKDADLAVLNERVTEQRNTLNAEQAKLEAELEAMTNRREELLKQLPASLRKRYQLLLDRRNGIAVVEARGGACLGCHMHLPPQQFNSLYVAAEVQSCPHCNRLLFIDDQDVKNDRE